MPHDYQVVSSELVYSGAVIALRRDEVTMPGGVTAVREVVAHPGAVAVVALDDDENVVLVHQYRHPVQRTLAELPAGLLDVAGEPALATAQRELAEEAGLAAREWHVLVDVLNSPGMTDEAARVFLARGLTDVERDVQQHEEAELTTTRSALGDVVRAILAGEYENSLLVAGVLAADRARASGWSGLRAANAPWVARAR